MTRWLTVIGIGEDGLEGLPPSSVELIKNADVLVGGLRHLSKVPDQGCERMDWGGGFFKAVADLSDFKNRNVVVLASGDPMDFGVGSTLRKRFAAEEMTVIPTPGAFSMTASRMGWSLPDVVRITVHGRPLEAVNLHLTPGARIIVLSKDGTTPKALSELLTAKGFGESRLTVFEHLGGDQENKIESAAEGWSIERTEDLNTIALDCVAGVDAVYWPRVPGLPEEAFEHDGKITKREVRAATLALLGPLPGDLLWDVGAGSGAVGIEWLRSDMSLRAIAFESNARKPDVIKRNADNLGVPTLKVIEGSALESFAGLDNAPNAIFVGGGVSNHDLLDQCWQRLAAGGRMVANGVTVQAQSVLMDFHAKHGGELTRISVARSDAVGSMTALRPFMDVLQFKAVKK